MTAEAQASSEKDIDNFMALLWSDVANDLLNYPARRPLLAHYTSIDVAFQILTGRELWLSNPLRMNDRDEASFIVRSSLSLLASHEGIKRSLKDPALFQELEAAYATAVNHYLDGVVFDTYVVCFCEHSATDENGLLSMWRGYGSDGAGAAVVFDTSRLDPDMDLGLWLGRVHYGTDAERMGWIDAILNKLSELIPSLRLDTASARRIAVHLIRRIITLGLSTKHDGFAEEHEWRVVYQRERDDDVDRHIDSLDCFFGPRGIEPKLRLQMGGKAGHEHLDPSNLVSKVMLGPAMDNPLAEAAFKRALLKKNLPGLADRVNSSRTPYRTFRR